MFSDLMDKAKVDAVLRRIINTKPMPFKEVAAEAVQDGDTKAER